MEEEPPFAPAGCLEHELLTPSESWPSHFVLTGLNFVAVMSKGNSEERARMMRALGAEVVLVDQLPGSMPGQVRAGRTLGSGADEFSEPIIVLTLEGLWCPRLAFWRGVAR